MSHPVPCPGCGFVYTLARDPGHRVLHCKKCDRRFRAAEDSPPTPEPAPIPSRTRWTQRLLAWLLNLGPTTLLPLSLNWFLLGLMLACVAPWLALLPTVLHDLLDLSALLALALVEALLVEGAASPGRWFRVRMAGAILACLLLAILALWWGPIPLFCLLVTLVLIGANLASAVWQVGLTGQVWSAVPMTLAQFLLFPLLFVQIAAHVGTDHYLWQGEPTLLTWPTFALFHAFRAGDLLDMAHSYGWNLSTARHGSLLTGLAVVAFYVLIDLFFLGAILAQFKRGHFGRWFRGNWKIVLGVYLAVWLVTAFWVGRWRYQDMLLWPIDHSLQAVDFADVLQTFDLQMHQVPSTVWEGTLGVLCRLLVSLALLGLIERFSQAIQTRWLGCYGIPPQELIQMTQSEADPKIREQARQRLAVVEARTHTLAVFPANPWHWLTGGQLRTLGLCALMALVVLALAGRWAWAVAPLVTRATESLDRGAQRALGALQRLGPYADDAVPMLTASLADMPAEQQQAILRTLGYLGPDAGPILGQYALFGPEPLARESVDALKRIGPSGAVPLARVIAFTEQEPLRLLAEQRLRELGPAAVGPLADATEGNNVGRHVYWAAQLDPYWHQRTSTSRLFNLRVAAWHKGPTQTTAELREMMKTESAAHLKQPCEEATPAILARCKTGTVGLADIEGLTRPYLQAPTWKKPHPPYRAIVGAIVSLIPNEDPPIRFSVLAALKQLGPEAREAVPNLLPLLPTDSINTVAQTLHGIDPDWERSPQVPAYFQKILESDSLQQRWDHVRWLSQRGSSMVEHLAKSDPKFEQRLLDIIEARSRQPGGSNAWDAQEVAVRILRPLGRTAPTTLTWAIRNYSTIQSPDARKESLQLFASPQAAAVLLPALSDPDQELALGAATLLTALRPKPAGSVPACIQALQAKTTASATRSYLIGILRDLGQEARPAIPILYEMSCYPAYGEHARQTLGRIDERWWMEPGLVRIVLPLLQSKEKPVLLLACQRVSYLGARAAEAVPELQRLEMHADPQIQSAALQARQAIARATTPPPR